MDPTSLIPAADAIPAAPWLFRLLLDATFTAHLLVMNAMLGFCLLGFARSFRPGDELGRLAGLTPNLTAITVNLGVAPLLFLQVLYGQFLYVSSTLMGVYWFSLVLAVMAAYGLAYRQKYALHAGQGPGTLLWALMSLLLLYVTLVQTHNAVLLIRPDLWAGYFENPMGTLDAWGDPTLVPRWLHFVTASAAMGGMGLCMIGRGRARHGDHRGERLEKEGLSVFGWATLVQAAGGVWWLMSLPRPAMLAFMGRDPLATGLLAAGLAGTALCLLFAFRRRAMAAAGALVLTVALMTAMRGVLRQLYLAPYFEPEKLPVRPEPSTLAMFLGCVAIALAVSAWAMRQPKADQAATGRHAAGRGA
jgi:hypothetical protein